MADQFDEIRAYCSDKSRVCPVPIRWNELWELLPSKQRKATGGWEPSLPLILGAWHETTNLEKIARLNEHLKWAADHGSLDELRTFICSLEESDWLHMGE